MITQVTMFLSAGALTLTVLCCLLPTIHADSNMAENKKVVVSSNDFIESGIQILKDNNFTVVKSSYSHYGEEGRTKCQEELLNVIPGATALIWCSHHPITDELLDKAGPSLKIVATASAGYNHCNVEGLKKRGIKLSNTPDVLSSAVAEITVSLMLGAARRFTENLEQVRTGAWEIGFTKTLGLEIRGSTVGIIGLGSIGQTIVRKLAGFEVERFVYTGHKPKPEAAALKAEFVPLDTLLKESDFVILAVPLTNETKHMINATTLGKMKSNAILVNIGRGDLVDQEALYDALKSRQLYAAGLDVTTPEPLPKEHKLLTLPNLFVLPHVGSATRRTRGDMADLAANNVVKALHGDKLITPVLE